MADFRRMSIDLLAADGTIDDNEVRVLRKHLYEDGKVTHSEVEYLMDLRKRVKTANATFDRFYLKACGDSILDNRVISHGEMTLIRKIVADKKLDHAEVRKFLHRLKKEAKPNADFDKYYDSQMKK